jgi:hypothetical protein
MKPIHDYASARAYTGENERLPVGGHVCQIRAARCDTSRNGKEMLVVAFDIKEGSEYDGFYKRRFDRAKEKNLEAKWPGLYYAVTTNAEGNTSPMFKGLITCIEESNPGYQWNWNEASLNGKMVGFNFGEEEYVHQGSGEIRTAVKPMFPASVSKVKDGSVVPPQVRKVVAAASAGAASGGFTQVDDDDLPF